MQPDDNRCAEREEERSAFERFQNSLDRSVEAANKGGAERRSEAVLAQRRPMGAAAKRQAPYLETITQSCGDGSEEFEAIRLEVRPCRCGSRFCSGCCLHKGLQLRDRLIPILKTFRRILMWTLTIDPKLFTSPKAAFDYVKGERCVSELMRVLRESPYLNTDRYFYVVEWQEKTEMPHFHLLIDSVYVPFAVICEIWNRKRPSWAGAVQGNRPPFGSVRYSAPEFLDATHGANYACKYLIKHPKYGYPDWVLNSNNIARYGKSQGFWGDTTKQKSEKAESELASSEKADKDRSTTEQLAPTAQKRRSIRAQLAACGQACSILEVVDEMKPDGELIERRRFREKIPLSFREVKAAFGQWQGTRFINITEEEAKLLAAGQLPENRNRAYGKQIEGNDQRERAVHEGGTD